MANFTPVSAAIGGALIGLSAVLLMLLCRANCRHQRDRRRKPQPRQRQRLAARVPGRPRRGATIGCAIWFSGRRSVDAQQPRLDRCQWSVGRVRYPNGVGLHVRSWNLRYRPGLAALLGGNRNLHGERDRGCFPDPPRGRRLGHARRPDWSWLRARLRCRPARVGHDAAQQGAGIP